MRWSKVPFKVFMCRYVRYELRRGGEVLATVRPDYAGEWYVSIPGRFVNGGPTGLDEAKKKAKRLILEETT